MEVLIVFGIVWIIFGCLGAWIANQKHRDGGEGFILGLLFGPIGCLIEAILPNGAAPPPPVVETPEQIAQRRQAYKDLMAQQAAEDARISAEWQKTYDARMAIFWRFVERM